MNDAVTQLYAEYLRHTDGDKSAAASLTLAGVLSRPTPEPIIVESDDRHPLGAKEAAMRLNRGSAKIYEMCLSGRLRCRKAGRAIHVPDAGDMGAVYCERMHPQRVIRVVKYIGKWTFRAAA